MLNGVLANLMPLLFLYAAESTRSVCTSRSAALDLAASLPEIVKRRLQGVAQQAQDLSGKISMEAAAPPPNEEEGASDGGDDSDDRKPAAVVESQSADSLSDQAKSSPRKRKAKDKSNHALRWEEMYSRLCDYHTR